MEANTEALQDSVAEAVTTDSEESKPSGRGGKRPGAGRKPNPAKILLKGVSREALEAGTAEIDVQAVVAGLLKDKKALIRLQTLNFVFDRLLGKPKQEIGMTGGFVHANARDPVLSSIPRHVLEELRQASEAVFAKHQIPILGTPPNGPQNQIESNTDDVAQEVGFTTISDGKTSQEALQPTVTLEPPNHAESPCEADRWR